MLLINNWTDHGSTVNANYIWLQAGQLYRIRLEYYERMGSSVITLSWVGPGLAEQIIPAQYFNVAGYNDWPDAYTALLLFLQANDRIYLDAIYPKVVKDSWLVLSTPDYEEVYKAEEVSDSSRKDFTLTAKTTTIKLSGENLIEKFDTHIRDTVVYAQSEELEIADKPFYDAIQNYQTVILAELMPGLSAEQR